MKFTRREQQDLTDLIILEMLEKYETVHWTNLQKKVLGSHVFATESKFRGRMHYLLNKNFVTKIQKGIYKITQAGTKYLETLRLAYNDKKKQLFFNS
ncbi:hypothetical protein J7L49_06895 [Candidatus Bathyarchaeota archaeon]|nr:hypothetical protein [Candidatus Bathyarchaeota archaeon]